MSMDNSMMVFFLSMLATYSIVGFVWWLLHVVAAWRDLYQSRGSRLEIHHPHLQHLHHL